MIQSTKVYGEPTSEGRAVLVPMGVYCPARESQPRVTSARMGQQGEVHGDRAEASEPDWGVQGKLLTGISVQAETYRVRRSWPCEDG